MRYAIVIEKAGSNFSAYVPDLPGCIATGATLEEVEREIREAIEFHIEGLREERPSRRPRARSATSRSRPDSGHGAVRRLACDPRFARKLSPDGILGNAESLVKSDGCVMSRRFG